MLHVHDFLYTRLLSGKRSRPPLSRPSARSRVPRSRLIKLLFGSVRQWMVGPCLMATRTRTSTFHRNEMSYSTREGRCRQDSQDARQPTREGAVTHFLRSMYSYSSEMQLMHQPACHFSAAPCPLPVNLLHPARDPHHPPHRTHTEFLFLTRPALLSIPLDPLPLHGRAGDRRRGCSSGYSFATPPRQVQDDS